VKDNTFKGSLKYYMYNSSI